MTWLLWVALIAVIAGLNIWHRRVLASMTPEERSQHEKEVREELGNWP